MTMTIEATLTIKLAALPSLHDLTPADRARHDATLLALLVERPTALHRVQALTHHAGVLERILGQPVSFRPAGATDLALTLNIEQALTRAYGILELVAVEEGTLADSEVHEDGLPAWIRVLAQTASRQ